MDFEGEYFTLKGITDSTFETRDQAIAKLNRRWREVRRDCFQYRDQKRYSVLFELIID